MLKADIAMFKRELDDALSNYKNAAQIQQANNLLKVNVVRVFLKLEDFDQASSLLKQILVTTPDLPEANYFTAQLAFRKNEFTQASTASDKVLAVIPDHIPSHYIKASASFALNRYELSLSHVNKVLVSHSNHASALKLLAATQLKLGLSEEASETLAKVGSEDFSENDIELLYAASNASFNAGFKERNQLFLKNIRTINRDDAQPDIQIALAQLENNKTEESIASIKSALEKILNLLMLEFC